MNTPLLITSLLVATLCAVICTLGVRRLARHFSIVAAPNPIVPQHTEPVAYLGGLGLAGGLLAGWMFSGSWPDPAILVGAGGMLCLGLVDDLRPLRPLPKLLAQGLIAGIAVSLGLNAVITGHAALDTGLVVLLIVTWVNAVNLTDVCDGLVPALTTVSMIGLAVLAGDSSQPLPLLVAAACLGFLVFNKPAASIYLGDAGSHLLGFLLAAVTLDGITRGHGLLVDLGAVLCSGVFLFELGFLVMVRRAKGLPWWRGSPDHFSLRMQAGPFTRTQSVLVASACAGLCVLCGWLLKQASLPVAGALLVLLAVAVAGVTYALLQWPVDGPQGDPR